MELLAVVLVSLFAWTVDANSSPTVMCHFEEFLRRKATLESFDVAEVSDFIGLNHHFEPSFVYKATLESFGFTERSRCHPKDVRFFKMVYYTCTSVLHGRCYSLLTGLNGGCSAGHVYTLNYCGPLEMCCYYQHQLPVTSAPHVVTHAPSHTSNSKCGVTAVGFTHNTKIVGGTIASHGELPWQVSLRYYNQHTCGGTLIGDRWILTAAHCFETLGNYAGQWTVGIGLQDQRQIYSSNIHHVSAIYTHEHFSKATNYNDIALMKLSKPVDLTSRYSRAACLPRSSDTFPSDICVVSGWGATYYDPNGHAPITKQLEYVSLQTISNQQCKYYLGYGNVHTSNICAGATSSGGKDACQGDSGGPLVCKKHGVWEIAGVVSWGDGCGKARRPGVYTRVTSYLDWINNKIQLHS